MNRRTFLLATVATVTAACARSRSDAAPPVTSPPGTTAGPTTTVRPALARFVVGASDSATVALTFHTNGRLDLAEQLYTLLDRRGVPATAFVVGNWLEANPSWAARLTGRGHELANHTWSHPSLSTLPPDAIAGEITRCRDALTRLTGQPGRWFRPSGTDDGTAPPSDAILEQAALAGYDWVAGFDVDPHDYEDPGAAAITSRTLGTLAPGSIVSLHAGHAGTISALPQILDGLAARGLHAVTLSQLVPA